MKKMILPACAAAAFLLGLAIGCEQEKKAAIKAQELYKKRIIIVN